MRDRYIGNLDYKFKSNKKKFVVVEFGTEIKSILWLTVV